VSRSRAAAIAGVVALVVAIAGATGCRPPAPRWNVVVVLVDALRADRLSLYGYERETSPELDRLARRGGIVFRHGWSNSGCTFPSVASLLTSQWPQSILTRSKVGERSIPREYPTLAQLLARHGWRTAAVSAAVAQKRSALEAHGAFFSRGFEQVDTSCLDRPARCVNEVARRRLADLPEPFFLYLHYVDPHALYQPPADAERRFAPAAERSAKPWVERGDPRPVARGLYDREPPEPPHAADVRRLSDLYDDEVRYFDSAFAELHAELVRKGLDERTIVVLVADHGEEMFENGGWGHCRDLGHDTVLRTPLVFFVPGLPAGERTTAAGNLDVVPTLLDLLGVSFDRARFAGDSLRPLLERGDRQADAERVVYSAQGVVRVAATSRRTVRFDLRRNLWLGGPESADPEEARLRRALHAWVRRVEGADPRRSVAEADAREAELRAIGYL